MTTTTQLSILTIVGYGPWTLTLGSDREHELQILQASIYAEVQRLFSERGCLAFANRSDEIIILSSGLNLEDHAKIQDALASKFASIRVRIAIGRGSTPAEADRAAHASSRSDAGMLDEGRMICGPPDLAASGDGTGAGPADAAPPGAVIMHLDIDGLSGRHASPYETSLLMLRLHQKMSSYFYDRCGSLTFFMGGDNFMVVSSEHAKKHAAQFADMIREQEGVQLNCGVGCATTAREAARGATESLDMIRKMRDSASSGKELHAASGGSHNNYDDDDDSGHRRCAYPRVYEHATGRSY